MNGIYIIVRVAQALLAVSITLLTGLIFVI
jgi:hypothetical protein